MFRNSVLWDKLSFRKQRILADRGYLSSTAYNRIRRSSREKEGAYRFLNNPVRNFPVFVLFQ